MNSLGADIIQLITQTLKPGGPGDPFDAFVITNDATNFSVGANLMLLLMAVQEEEWDDVDMVIRQFQGMTQAIKFSPKPVVIGAPDSCWGGTDRCTLRRQPRGTLPGLVGGLGGLAATGTWVMEMLLRALESATSIRPDGRGESVGCWRR
jgi:3-hydroxyacyl-CoA dehydrogenase